MYEGAEMKTATLGSLIGDVGVIVRADIGINKTSLSSYSPAEATSCLMNSQLGWITGGSMSRGRGRSCKTREKWRDGGKETMQLLRTRDDTSAYHQTGIFLLVVAA